MSKQQGWRSGVAVVLVAIFSSGIAASRADAAIVGLVEAPDGIASGVGNVAGWAYSTASGATILSPIEVLIDGVTLSLLGAGLGLLLAKAGLEYITLRLAIFDLPGPLTFQLSPKVVWFALGAAIFSGMVSALIPAWRASRIDAFAVLKDEARGSASVHSGRLSRGLLTLQVGGSALLLWIGLTSLGLAAAVNAA